MILYFVFFIFIYCSYSTDLSSRDRLDLLDVVLIQVLLEIEVGQLLSLRDLEELAESSIGLDVVLVLQVLLLDVVVQLLGDIGAGD